jgi:hypothetical protein
MTQQDPERRTARNQRDSGGAAEAQKSGGPTTRKTVPRRPQPPRRTS